MKEVCKRKFANGVVYAMETEDGYPVEVTDTFLPFYTKDAIQWFVDNGISLYGVNKNPTQHTWTSSPKAYGQLIIDDTCLGIPLVSSLISHRPFVNWNGVRDILVFRGIL